MEQNAKSSQPQAGKPAANAAPQATGSGSSLSGTVLIILILAAGGSAYYLGYLDKPLAELGLVAPNAPDATDATQVLQEAATPSPVAPAVASPAPLVAPPSSNSESMTIQLAALQRRISSLEKSNRDLLAITESHADQLVRQGPGGGGGSPFDLVPLQLELIDLRLRLSGDTIVAEQELGVLATTIDESSQLGQLIKQNRQKLLGLPPRILLMTRIDELAELVATSRLAVLQDIADARNADELKDNWLAALFNVKRDDEELLTQLNLIDELAAAIVQVKPNLLLRDAQGYVDALAAVQTAADRLRDHSKSLDSTSIARILAELVATGFPDARLELALSEEQAS